MCLLPDFLSPALWTLRNLTFIPRLDPQRLAERAIDREVNRSRSVIALAPFVNAAVVRTISGSLNLERIREAKRDVSFVSPHFVSEGALQIRIGALRSTFSLEAWPIVRGHLHVEQRRELPRSIHTRRPDDVLRRDVP